MTELRSHSPQRFDLVINGGLWFDGTGQPGQVRNLGIRDGRLVAATTERLNSEGAEVIQAAGRWVTPGFIDVHTHYDAEVLVNPGLGESVRHGVTTVVMGSCSLSTIYSPPEDVADLFSRVEAVPYESVIDTLKSQRDWIDAASYVESISSLPLGPNVSTFVGHSDLRAHVMGLGRSVDPAIEPTPGELDAMVEKLEAAMAAGMLGMSTMTTALDKVGGERFRSRALPSTYASWNEYRRLNRVLRRHDRVLQSAPNAKAPLNILLFIAQSSGWFRRRLRTSLLAAADPKSMPGASQIGTLIRILNRLMRSDVKMQHLPVPFELYSDGIDLPVFEELGAGAEALHLQDEGERQELMRSASYRRRFRRQYHRRFRPGLWHRDFYDAEIIECPDRTIVGKTFGQVADDRNLDPVDAFIDLIVTHGNNNVRWRTTVANHRPEQLDRMATNKGIQIGFSDAGAHLRNMAFYNCGLRLLRRVNDASLSGRPFMTIEAAVHRLTGELGDWFGLAAGTLRIGDPADLVVINPAALDETVDNYREAIFAPFGGLSRMVRRNDDVVELTCVNGIAVYSSGKFVDGYGESVQSGVFLQVGQPRTFRTSKAYKPKPILNTTGGSL